MCFQLFRGRVTHICVSKLTTIGSDNGLSPGRRQANIWTNAGILLIGPLGTNFIEILIRIQTFSFKKMHLKMSSAKWRPFCLGLNVFRRDRWMKRQSSPDKKPRQYMCRCGCFLLLLGNTSLPILTHCGLVTPYGSWSTLAQTLVMACHLFSTKPQCST